MSKNLGTLVVFAHNEYGSVDIAVVMYISPWQDKEKQLELFQQLSGYPLDHERYETDIIDLTKYYFAKGYGADVSYETSVMGDYAPELLLPTEKGEVYSSGRLIRVHQTYDHQVAINRKYDEVNEFLTKLRQDSVARRGARHHG